MQTAARQAPRQRGAHLHALPGGKMERERPEGAYVPLPVALLRCRGLSHGAKVLYGLLADYAGTSAQCWPKQETLRTELSCSDHTIRGFVSELRAAGFITVKRRGQGKTDIYHLVSEPTETAVLDTNETADQDPQKLRIIERPMAQTAVLDTNETADPIKEERKPKNENQEATAAAVVGPPAAAAIKASSVAMEKTSHEGQAPWPAWVDEIVDQIGTAVGLAYVPADRRREWRPVIRDLLGHVAPPDRARFAGWMNSNGYFSDRLYLVSRELAGECEQWLSSKMPDRKRRRAQSDDRSADGGHQVEPNGQPVTMCACHVRVGGKWTHEPGCALRGRVTLTNYIDLYTGERHVTSNGRAP